jgi:hypothetical protein
MGLLALTLLCLLFTGDAKSQGTGGCRSGTSLLAVVSMGNGSTHDGVKLPHGYDYLAIMHCLDRLQGNDEVAGIFD